SMRREFAAGLLQGETHDGPLEQQAEGAVAQEMDEVMSRFTGDEPVDDPAGEVDEAQIRGEEDEEGEEIAGDVTPQDHDGQELLDGGEDGADGHERNQSSHGHPPGCGGPVMPVAPSPSGPRRRESARWPG